MLGAKGNEWAWKSRKWDNINAFKAHQRAWTKWSLITSGSFLTLFFLVVFFFASVPELRKAVIEGYKTELTKGKSVSNSPPKEKRVKSVPPSLSSPTSTNNQLLKVEIDQLETFTYPSGLFSLDVPTGWSLQDKSKSREAFVVWTDKNLNAMLSVDLFATQRELTQDELINVVQTLLIHSFQSQQDFNVEPPQTQEDKSVRITWGYTAVATNGTKIKVMGNSFIGKLRESNKISIFSYLVPVDQWSELQAPMNQILNSYRINPSAPLP
jgi:serine/threonine-protein kinase